MSHRITNKITLMTDASLVERALRIDDPDVQFDAYGDRFSVRSGTFKDVVIDLKTQEVYGDEDYVSKKTLQLFTQRYAEAAVLREYEINSTYVTERTEENGEVILRWATA